MFYCAIENVLSQHFGEKLILVMMVGRLIFKDGCCQICVCVCVCVCVCLSACVCKLQRVCVFKWGFSFTTINAGITTY